MDFLCQKQINTNLKTYYSAVTLDDIFREFYASVLWMYKGGEYSVASVDQNFYSAPLYKHCGCILFI